MNITLNLTEEETDALAIKTAWFNAHINGNLTPEQYLIEEVISKSLAQMSKEARDAQVQRLGIATAPLPYAEWKALIAQVEAAVQGNP